MRFTYDDYKHKRCTGLEYAKQQFLGEDKGEIVAYKMYGTRYLYSIKRKTTKMTYDGEIPCIEYKLYDLDNSQNSCVCKFRQLYGKPMSAKEYLDKCLRDTEVQNYIESRMIYCD